MPVCFVKVPGCQPSMKVKIQSTNQTSNKEIIDECAILQSSNINNSHYNLSKKQ
jgi:hypothetical protein